MLFSQKMLCHSDKDVCILVLIVFHKEQESHFSILCLVFTENLPVLVKETK